MELKFVICGLEHSGTTLVSDIFRQVKNIDSGFECGVLLGNSPRQFSTIQPFYSNMLAGWQISKEQLMFACDTENFPQFYNRIYEQSDFFSNQTQYLFDKTPRYFWNLFDCYHKVEVPFIATYKDPRAVVFSDFKRSGKGKSFEEWYKDYKEPKLRYLSNIYIKSYLEWKCKKAESISKILCVSLEDICLNTREVLEKMFSHVNCDFHVRYLLMKNLRYAHTRLPQVSSRIPFEYLDAFTEKQLKIIEEDFSVLDDWFYR